MLDALVYIAVAVMLLAPLPAIVTWSLKRTRPRLALLLALVLLPALWWADLAAILVNYRDAGGHMDCWPSCTVWQDAAGLVIWYAPPATALLVLVALVDVVRVSREAR